MNTVESLFSEKNDDDWRGLHDVVIDTLDISLTRKELKIIFKKLPNHIQSIGLEWGLMDTVF